MAFHNIPPNGFPDIPDMEELEAVVKDVTSLKTSLAGLATDVTNLNSNKANQITIAPFFNPETSYGVGDLVYYNGLSYRCTNDHEGEWDADDFAATTIAGELDALKSGLTNMTALLQITQLSDTATQYQLQGNYSDYMFVAIILGWYTGASNDNMVVIPANNWLTNDYLMLYRHNDPSTQAYARIENRGNGYITALGTEGVSVSVVGFIHK